MASKAQASAAFLLALNLLFFSMVSATETCPANIYADVEICGSSLTNILSILLAPTSQCCGYLGLPNVDIAACICLAIDAKILGLPISLTVDASVKLLFQKCNKSLPSDFTCSKYY